MAEPSSVLPRAGGGGWSGPTKARATEPEASGVRAALSAQGVVGQARDVHTSSYTDWFLRDQATILRFRVEGFDEHGNRMFLVPVELRGLTIEGFVAEGDWVRTTGRTRGGTIRASRVENLTSESVVSARGAPFAMKLVITVGLLAIAAFMLFAALG